MKYSDSMNMGLELTRQPLWEVQQFTSDVRSPNNQCWYRIIPNRGAVHQGNGLEIHNLETELILPVFKSKLYHY